MKNRQALLAPKLRICTVLNQQPDADEVTMECRQVQRRKTIVIARLLVDIVLKLLFIISVLGVRVLKDNQLKVVREFLEGCEMQQSIAPLILNFHQVNVFSL